MKKMQLLAAAIVVNHSARAQIKFSGKYIRDEYPAGYLIISDDGNFKFKFGFDQLWDLIILNNRIRTVKTGDVHEHESVDFRQYYYKRKRNHRRS